jgi:hypothetical protein
LKGKILSQLFLADITFEGSHFFMHTFNVSPQT